MIKLLKLFLTEDATVNIIGTIVTSIFGLVFFVAVSRILGSFNFGIFAATQALQFVMADIFDLGTNTGILRFLPKAADNSNLAESVLKIALEIKTIVGVAIFLIGLILSGPLARFIFGNSTLTSTVFLSFLILPTILLGFSVSVLQAKKQFAKAAVLNILTNIFRLIILAIVVLTSQLTIFSSLAIFVLTPLFGFIISPFFFRFNFVWQAKREWKLVKEFLSFNKWVTLAFSTAAVQNRIDSILLIRLATPIEAGLYAAPSKLLSIYPLISGALSTAFAPSFAAKGNIEKGKQIFKSTTAQTLVFALLSLIPLLFAKQIVELVYGVDFAGSVKTFQVLNLAMFFMIISAPSLTAIIYLYAKPQYYSLLTLLQLVITIVGNVILIPRYGAVGAAITFFVSMTAFYLLATLYCLRRLQTKNED